MHESGDNYLDLLRNEQEVLGETTRQMAQLLRQLHGEKLISFDSRVLLVDDGSSDDTWPMIHSISLADSSFVGLKLSRNRGHQRAVLAGIQFSNADAVITIDADLQDDVNAIREMVQLWHKGIDIVYGVRSKRASDTIFKRLSAEGYYKLLAMFGVEIIFNHADYRLMSRRAIDALSEFSEVNLFLRGIVPQLGFPTAIVHYDRAERFAGESKYPLKKMLALAWEGVTSFSTVPLRLITTLGLLISVGSFATAFWAIFVRVFTDDAVPGWASTVIPTYLLGGVQLLCIGIIGEYLAKVYLETKRRPAYFIESVASQPVHNQSVRTHAHPAISTPEIPSSFVQR